MRNKDIKSILNTENARIEKLHKIVEETIQEEELIMQNLMNPPSEELSRGQKISDKVARFGGSWYFIISFGSVLVIWIIFNVLALTEQLHFDPFPFILLNLILSFVAAFQAPIIMMSQNRQAARDKHESIIDFAINYKAEQEIDDMQKHLHRMEAELAEIKEMLKEGK